MSRGLGLQRMLRRERGRRLVVEHVGDAYFGPNYGGATVNTVTRSGFAGQCANLARLFRQMTFSVDVENRIIADMLDNKTSPALAAQHALKAEPTR
ncbi:glycine betaine ABC transporter substrate-binding protein, partial [Acinetobacter baumannii]|uniref:glycine betaine ABC transporter substrate-binding protein n=1 Tax=Acinetobacter baumannii TaxID=470 RepID=UPI0024B82A01